MRLGDLASGQLAGDGRPTVVLLPVGAVEPHGPHAPLATDTLISLGMCERAARALDDVRVLIAPPLHYGVTRYGAAFPGAIGISEATLRALLAEVCDGLRAQGLDRIVVVNNHFEPDHVATLRAVVGELGDGVVLLDLLRRANAERLTEEFRSGSCHAGRYETSLVLADRPELVDAERMRALPEVPVDMPAQMAAGNTDFLAMGMADAYCGAPAQATAQEGEATFATLTELLVDAIRALV